MTDLDDPSPVWDHYIPLHYSRDNRDINFVAACGSCNTIKGAKVFWSADEARDYIEGRRNTRRRRDDRRARLRLAFDRQPDTISAAGPLVIGRNAAANVVRQALPAELDEPSRPRRRAARGMGIYSHVHRPPTMTDEELAIRPEDRIYR